MSKQSAMAGEALRPSEAARQRLCFALDYPNGELALAGARDVAAGVGVLKVGLELFLKEGPPIVSAVRELGPVFLDLKLHDIPTTVERAVASAISLGARYLTLHASGGPSMIEAARRCVDAERSSLQLLAVTVLTSMSVHELEQVGIPRPPLEQVSVLGRMATDAGAHGLVCSPAEAANLRRELGPSALLVTPGIRPFGTNANDQSRAQTPAMAIAAGADLLVVGRPIRDAAVPLAAAASIVDEMARAAER